MKVPTKPTVTHLIDEAREAAKAFHDLSECERHGQVPSDTLISQLVKSRQAMLRWEKETRR